MKIVALYIYSITQCKVTFITLSKGNLGTPPPSQPHPSQTLPSTRELAAVIPQSFLTLTEQRSPADLGMSIYGLSYLREQVQPGEVENAVRIQGCILKLPKSFQIGNSRRANIPTTQASNIFE